MHKEMLKMWSIPGVHVVLGARKNGKTSTAKKQALWLLLTGRWHQLGVMSESLRPQAQAILSDLAELIFENPRIMYDFKVKFLVNNSESVVFRVAATKEQTRRKRYITPYSIERSLKGSGRVFNRLDGLLIDDLQTRTSPLSIEHTKEVIRRVAEALQSLNDGGTIVWCGNNFDQRTATNHLLTEQNQGILASNWKVYLFPAWDGKKPLWKERYKATSESELKAILKPYDQSEWLSEFQQKPAPPEGLTFKREHLRIIPIIELPSDARGVMYVDPNLSKKGRGDTTAMGALLYSVETEKYYVVNPRCKSYSSSDELLRDYFAIRNNSVRRQGFDGNVSQESTWSNNVRNYCVIHQLPMPSIVFCRYRVDDLAKNLQIAWENGKVIFTDTFVNAEEKERALSQFFAFHSKKEKGRDDFPDFLISAFEFIHEEKLVRRANAASYEVFSLTEHSYF
jgi:hypothetical protein